LLSATAFKRDVSDPQTVEDFVGTVASVERLRHLAVLTAVDIRAVGPGTWNSWKGQMLGALTDAAEERLRLGHVRHARTERVAARRTEVADLLNGRAELVTRLGDTFNDAFWIAENPSVIAGNLLHLDQVMREKRRFAVACTLDTARGATLVSVVAADQAGLFYRLAAGIHLAGGNIIDARIHTTRDGWAVDNFLVQSAQGEPFLEEHQIARVERSIADALFDRFRLGAPLGLPPSGRCASGNLPRCAENRLRQRSLQALHRGRGGRPRPSGAAYHLARALFDCGLAVHSAHITAYGERVLDTFYVTDQAGGKLPSGGCMSTIEERLLAAAGDAQATRLETV
jgi:[protein-PII] uridylyltransferase